MTWSAGCGGQARAAAEEGSGLHVQWGCGILLEVGQGLLGLELRHADFEVDCLGDTPRALIELRARFGDGDRDELEADIIAAAEHVHRHLIAEYLHVRLAGVHDNEETMVASS